MSVGDKISNAAEKAAGAAKETVGKATGDRETQAEGTEEEGRDEAGRREDQGRRPRPHQLIDH